MQWALAKRKQTKVQTIVDKTLDKENPKRLNNTNPQNTGGLVSSSCCGTLSVTLVKNPMTSRERGKHDRFVSWQMEHIRVAGILLHLNWKFTIGKSKSSIVVKLHSKPTLNVNIWTFSGCNSMSTADQVYSFILYSSQLDAFKIVAKLEII